MGPNQTKPLSLEGLILSTHANHKFVNAGDPCGNGSSMPDTVHVPVARAKGPRVGGLPDAQSPKAVRSRLTKPHRGSRRGSHVSA